MEKMKIWEGVKQPPKTALKTITGGRLKGMTDINPQWRYQILTEIFGPCGIGWGYDIIKLWNEPASDGQLFAFAEIELWIKVDDVTSAPIPGIGGSMLISQEKRGLYSSDEGYKMAVTDALSVACKALGIGADIYAGKWDGSKYSTDKKTTEKISVEQIKNITDMIEKSNSDIKAFLGWAKVKNISEITTDEYTKVVAALTKKIMLAEKNK